METSSSFFALHSSYWRFLQFFRFSGPLLPASFSATSAPNRRRAPLDAAVLRFDDASQTWRRFLFPLASVFDELEFFLVLRPCFRRRFRLLGAGRRRFFYWMRRFSGLTTLPESGVDSFSGWRRRSFVDGSRRRYSRLISSFRDARRT